MHYRLILRHASSLIGSPCWLHRSITLAMRVTGSAAYVEGAFTTCMHVYRIYGVKLHCQEVHSWLPHVLIPKNIEYHLSFIFFNMDSSLDCFLYAMNDLGNTVAPNEFPDVTNEKALRQVAPWNIFSSKNRCPLMGYRHYFPPLQAHWKEKEGPLSTITEQHNVSKHRSTILYRGGMMRLLAYSML